MESLIEDLFTRLAPGDLTLRTIATQLLRAMEDHALEPSDSDHAPIAPDSYTLTLHPDSISALKEQSPDFALLLTELVSLLAAEAGLRLPSSPNVAVRADTRIAKQSSHINVEHKPSSLGATQLSPSVADDAELDPVAPASLRIAEGEMVELRQAVVNIGRGPDNDIVIDDAYVSRHHLQLRRRYGRYALFDVKSRGGTRVNDIVVSEHPLQDGDRIHIGRTILSFLE